MTTWPAGMADWIEERLGPGSSGGAVLLSVSNSRVWRIEDATGRSFIAKHLLDPSSMPVTERTVGRLLRERGSRRARPVLDVRRNTDGTHYVLAEYAEGSPLADVLGTERTVAPWTEQLCELLRDVGAIEVSGFGKLSGALCAPWRTWSSFLLDYSEEQRLKAPVLASAHHYALDTLLAEAAPLLDAAAPRPRLVAADINSRNFVVGPDGLVNVNLPVLWGGDPTAAYGQALIHWADTDGEEVLFHRSGAPRWLLHLYAAFHAYVILAYAERFTPGPLDSVTPWGRTTPLVELLDRHLAAVRLPSSKEKGVCS
ncbi:hypothetical protein ACFV6E_40015 [Streptomyces sp. NPDC059785]|uniref:hypothetical protein n=1 Tax=unclassified Streptomyces TaxID=2593676 RepID=UPI003658B060